MSHKKKRISNEEAAEIIKEYQKKVASKGGKARAKKLTPERRKEIADKAIRTRWDRKES